MVFEAFLDKPNVEDTESSQATSLSHYAQVHLQKDQVLFASAKKSIQSPCASIRALEKGHVTSIPKQLQAPGSHAHT